MDSRYFESGAIAYVSQAAEASKVVKATPGKAFSIDVISVAVADRFLFAFDSAGALAGNLLFPPFKIPAGGFVSLEYRGPLTFDTGLVLASSTAQGAFAAGGADLMMRVLHK